MIARLVLASANPNKAAEIEAIVGSALSGVELIPRPVGLPDVVEDGLTLLDNARLKATAVASAAGEPALADDTGLEVEALGGAPGVLTARFAGNGATDAANVSRLLAELEGVINRRASFRTVVIIRWPDGKEVTAEGVVDGTISTERRGDHGFGYDPVFVPTTGDGRTFAELGAEAKNAISHRSAALHALATKLSTTSP